MDAVVEEIALRAYSYAEARLQEIIQADNEAKDGEEIEKPERMLLDFITRWKAGSLYIDLFTESAVRQMMDQVFGAPSIQVFVFDLKFHAMVGIPENTIPKLISDIAYHLTPGFGTPKADSYGNLNGIKKVLSEFEFTDTKWKLKQEEIAAVMEYMPWMVPLMLISLGETIAIGTSQDSTVTE